MASPQEGDMASPQEEGVAAPGQLTSSAVEALLRDGTLAGSWTLDPGRSEVQLKTRHTWGLAPLKGVFRQVTGTGTVSETGEVSGIFTVAAASIDTKNKRRDQHLRSADFFDIASHPDFTFAVDGAAPANGGVRVTGRLAIRDRTRPVPFDAKVSSVDGELWLDAEVPVNRADFGMTWNWLGIAPMDNTIVVHAVFTRQ
jgi:polyisoprenoid-binding protein YceI